MGIAGDAQVESAKLATATAFASILVRSSIPFFRETNARNSGLVVLYPALNLAYNRLKKVANNSIRHYLRDLSGEKRKQVSPGQNSLDSSTLEQSLNSILGRKLLVAVSSFDWACVVRDPYERLLSAYLDKSRHDRYGHIPGFSRRDAVGFRRFVEYIGSGGLNADRHWSPQSASLFLNPNSYGKLIPMTQLSNFFSDLRRENCLPPVSKKNYQTSHKLDLKQTNNSSRFLADFYDQASISTVDEMYRLDFKLYQQALERWDSSPTRQNST